MRLHLALRRFATRIRRKNALTFRSDQMGLLRLGIGYKLQEQRHGGLQRTSRSLLRHSDPVAGKGPPPRKLTPGTKLVRDWHGVGHTVTVLADGFDYDGGHWKSLTAIALAITGTKWNGPRFFGLSGRRK